MSLAVPARSSARRLLAAALALGAVAASAQTPKAGSLTTDPIAPGGTTSPIKTVALSVLYLYDPEWKVTVASEPAASFTCVQGQGQPTGGDAVPYNPLQANTVTCTARVSGTRLELHVSRVPANGPPGLVIGQSASGKQWGGACAGTMGTACTVRMQSGVLGGSLVPRTASVSWGSQP